MEDDEDTDSVNKYGEAVAKVLLQHWMASAARDAGSRYPNTARVGRNAVNVLDQINLITSQVNGQGNIISQIAGMLGGKVDKDVNTDTPPIWAQQLIDDNKLIKAKLKL